MHKSSIFGFLLAGMLFLAATTAMSMKVSALDETEILQPFSGSKKHDLKKHDLRICQTGPLKGFYVVNIKFCFIELPEGPKGPPGDKGPPGSETCEDCFRSVLNTAQLEALDAFLAPFPSHNLAGYCDIIERDKNVAGLESELKQVLLNGQRAISDAEIAKIIQCLRDIGILPPAQQPIQQDLSIQQNTDKPSSISQEQMHQQQIEKLKHFLASVR